MKRERKFYLKIILGVYFIWLIFFEAVGRYASVLPTRDFTSYVDRQIPFIPGFVWPYVLCYVFPFLPLFVIKDWHRFNRALLSIILANLSAFIVYLSIPISFPRPELGQSLSERLLSFIYGVDFHPGANKLPSLNVTFTWIIYLVCYKQRLGRLGESIILFFAVLISLSALFVKQHIILDVLAGVFWAFGSWKLAGFLYNFLIHTRIDARAGLKQMTKNLVPIVIMFGAVLLTVVFFR